MNKYEIKKVTGNEEGGDGNRGKWKRGLKYVMREKMNEKKKR